MFTNYPSEIVASIAEGTEEKETFYDGYYTTIDRQNELRGKLIEEGYDVKTTILENGFEMVTVMVDAANYWEFFEHLMELNMAIALNSIEEDEDDD